MESRSRAQPGSPPALTDIQAIAVIPGETENHMNSGRCSRTDFTIEPRKDQFVLAHAIHKVK